MNPDPKARQMILGWLMNPCGTHRASWMTFAGRPDPLTDIDLFKAMAQEAERAKFDFIFQADWPSVRPGPPSHTARNVTYNVILEPISLMSTLAAVTSKIGVVATGSTTFSEPYTLARQFASLDHISHGRAGWNIVTTRSPIASLNYGLTEEVPHADRYKRGEEFVDVTKGLWDSYEDDAIVRDTERGLYFDPDKLHVLNYKSEEFSVRGPLNISRPPQGNPVLFQAGASDIGMQLGARVGEVIFCLKDTIEAMQDYSRKVKEAAVQFGRSPDEVKVVCGFDIVVKKTAAEAKAAIAALDEMLHPDAIKDVVSADIEADITHLDLDDLVTFDMLPEDANSSKSADAVIRGWLEEKPMTVREIYNQFSRSRSAVGIHGDPMQVADKLEEWFISGATDGFMFFFPLASGMWDFNELVVPELQRRGLFRREYTGETLRENLGLPRPVHSSKAESAHVERIGS